MHGGGSAEHDEQSKAAPAKSAVPVALPAPQLFLKNPPLRRAKAHCSHCSGPARGSSCGCHETLQSPLLLLLLACC